MRSTMEEYSRGEQFMFSASGFKSNQGGRTILVSGIGQLVYLLIKDHLFIKYFLWKSTSNI